MWFKKLPMVPHCGICRLVMVNIMCQPDQATSYPNIWLHSISSMSVRGDLDEINIQVGRLSKADGPLQYRWVSSIIQSFEGLNRTKRLSKGESLSLLNCLPAWTLIFSCLCICTWTGIYTIESTGSWVFRLQLELPLLALLGLQLANYSSWDFSASIIM